DHLDSIAVQKRKQLQLTAAQLSTAGMAHYHIPGTKINCVLDIHLRVGAWHAFQRRAHVRDFHEPETDNHPPDSGSETLHVIAMCGRHAGDLLEHDCDREDVLVQ